MNNPYLELAKKTVETYIKTGKIISPANDLPKKMLGDRAGVFVSIHLKNGELRGCIGTFAPTQKNIAEEIIHNAIESATQDPRFPPVTESELSNLVYSVDILSRTEPVTNPSTLNPKTYGLIVQSSDGRRGLLLPDLEGVDTVNQQINICRQKAWISEDEPVSLYKFTVERHQEKITP